LANRESKTKEKTEDINNGKAEVPRASDSTPVTKENINETVIPKN